MNTSCKEQKETGQTCKSKHKGVCVFFSFIYIIYVHGRGGINMLRKYCNTCLIMIWDLITQILPQNQTY